MNAIEVLGFVATAYFTAPLSLLAGGVTLSSTLPTLGMLCGLVGLSQAAPAPAQAVPASPAVDSGARSVAVPARRTPRLPVVKKSRFI